MDGKNFAKLCKDSGLVSKNLTTVDIDIIFSKVSTATLLSSSTALQALILR